MIERERIERIVSTGVHAPSGDNSQPWSFHIEHDVLDIFAHSDEDHAILNIDARGTYLAIGALIENIAISAEHDGLSAYVVLFPDDKTAARITFIESSASGHRLYDAIRARHTHRGPYGLPESPPVASLKHIHEPHCTVEVVTDEHAIRAIAQSVSVMEEVALATRKLHRLFFDSILWDAKANSTGAPGLFIKTTELPKPIQVLFRLIRYWPVQRFFNALGLPKAAAGANAAVYERSAAIVAILVKDTQAEDYIHAGRCMQRAWLQLTAEGFVAQPLAGLLYLAEYLERTEDADFDSTLAARALAARTSIEEQLGAARGGVAMLLRCGHPLAPATARSKRRAPRYV